MGCRYFSKYSVSLQFEYIYKRAQGRPLGNRINVSRLPVALISEAHSQSVLSSVSRVSYGNSNKPFPGGAWNNL